MPRVNYIAECRDFQRFAINQRLTANEFMLWHGLLELFNKEARGADWPEEYLTLANSVVLAQTSFGAGDSAVDILFRARKGLVKHGLICYRKGKRNALMPQYKMNYFTLKREMEEAGDGAQTALTALMNTGKTERDADNMTPRTEDNKEDKVLDKPLKNPINQDLNAEPKPLHTALAGKEPSLMDLLRDPPCELVFDLAWQSSSKARGAVAQRLLDQYQGEVNVPDAWDALCEVMGRGVPPDAILRLMPERPMFSRLMAALLALAQVNRHGSGQVAALLEPYKNKNSTKPSQRKRAKTTKTLISL